MNMWDYDKLFAEGNIIGISPVENEVVNIVCSKSHHNIDGIRRLYSNNDLSYCEMKIQYIIRLDKHGNVVEKLFDRERDVKPEPKPMPELETGMFVRVEDEGFGYVDTRNNRIIYQHGGYDILDENEYLLYVFPKIIEVYSKSACAFSCCDEDVLIWRDPDYQAYLDSKVQ